MDKDKKIEIQNRVINELKEENTKLQNKINELESYIKENTEIVSASSELNDEYRRCIADLMNAKDRYNDLIKTMLEQNKKCKKDFKSLFSALK